MLALLLVGVGIIDAAAAPSARQPILPGCRPFGGGYFPGRDEAPVFSPDGTRILFNRDWSTMSCLVVLDLRTRTLTVADKGLDCTCAAALPGDFTWSPDGGQVALTVWTNVRRKEMALDVVTPGRSDARELVTGRFLPGAVWSPDGKQLAVVGSMQPGTGTAIWLVDAITGTARDLAAVPSVSFEQRWSPDSSRIAFWTGKDVEVVDVASGVPATVASRAMDASWSPDGSKLALVRSVSRRLPGSSRLYTTTELFVSNVDGSGLRDVGGRGLDEHQPEWSPDGRSIAFLADYRDGRDPRTKQPTYAGPGLNLVGADGTGRRILVGPYTIHDIASFDWSADGKQIVFEHDGGRRDGGLYLIRSDGTGLRRLTSTP